ncbi:beta-ketoacyl synthase N-terminal-like domain-containing protein [Streptomyces sp. NPDC102405]|uniref:beta-ketoacyl synthase N-terminal-like domain-containing protein n=1 Tax=Streptomyces sp. NPDC102405 TaxID=3366170 RepID=UPI003824CAF4
MDSSTDLATDLDIAIIAMEGRFPGATNLEQFWENLAAGREAVTHFSDEQYLAAGGDPRGLDDPYLVKAEAVVEDIDQFDAAFFGYRTRDAELMDPQHRLLLECSHHALEQAGYVPDAYPGAIGVYAGASMSKYWLFNVYPHLIGSQDSLELLNAAYGSTDSSLATRISYALNLKGPSLYVQTACSTSLVAVHLACQDLLSYRCDMALAGGASISPARHRGYRYVTDGPYAPDGHCRAFDADAQGMFPGDGAGVVLLKRLTDALADGDRIRGVIKGSAVNNDGDRKVGFTAPSVPGQAEVITAAHAVAAVDADSITYVEAHGTATPVGDPIEVSALTQAFAQSTQRAQFCALGSVKTNIGHLDAAAGVAGLIKTVLALEHRMIPPSLHFHTPNPLIDFTDSPFYVPTALTPWTEGTTPRRAGVSSFGIGGTNAHLVVEQAPPPLASGPAPSWSLLTLSAKTPTALETMTRNLGAHLGDHRELNIADVAHTLQTGRQHHPYRRTLMVTDTAQAAATLQDPERHGMSTSPGETGKPAPVFMFPGWGAQYPDMGAQLYETEPVYRSEIDACADILLPVLGKDLRDILFPTFRPAAETVQAELDPAVDFPAIVATEYAMARLLMSKGITPKAMIGHSLGEYTAACLADVISLKDVLPLVAERGRLFTQAGTGSMLAVSLGADQIQRYLGGEVSLAAINGRGMCTVSGPVAAIGELEHRLTADGIDHRSLRIASAAHSSLLDPILDAYEAAVARVELREPTLPFLSNVTGTWITAQQATDPAYWRRHTRDTVRFADGLDEVCADHEAVLLEVGPGQTLTKLAQRHLRTQTAIPSMRQARSQESDASFLLQALGQLWLRGVQIDWLTVSGRQPRTRVPLPGYPFERRRYWIDPPSAAAAGAPPTADELAVPVWKACALPTDPLAVTGSATPAHWLIFADERGLGDALAQRLTRAGHDTTVVRAGDAFQRVSDHTYVIDPAHSQDYHDLLAEAEAAAGRPVDAAVHLWGTEGPAPDSAKAVDNLRQLEACAAALAAAGHRLRLWIGGQNVFPITGTEPLSAEGHLLAGGCQALARLHPQLETTLLDLSLDAPTTRTVTALAQRLADEVRHAAPRPQVAYRGLKRWVYEHEALPEPAGQTPHPLAGPEARFLVPDGLQDPVYRYTAYLAELTRGHLLIGDNSGMPDRAQWDRWAPAAGHSGAAPGTGFDLTAEHAHLAAAEDRLRRRIHVEEVPTELAGSLERLCTLYISDYFRAAGITPTRGSSYSRDEIAKRLRLLPQYEPFLDAFLEMLTADAIVTVDDGTVQFLTDGGDAGDAARLKADIAERFPDYRDDLAVLEHCATHYGPALSGDIDANEVLVPDGDDGLLRRVIDNRIKSSDIAVYRPLVAEAVQRLVDNADGRPVRILEVGAGRGYLTWLVADILKDHPNVRYHVTDIGRSFVLSAQQQAREQGLDFLTFATLDISQDPVTQGYEAGAYDLVLAFNVLHATADLTVSLGHVNTLLAPGGALFLLEAAGEQRWSTMMSGLAPGWWYFDDDVRSTSPLLSPDQWTALLASQGYRGIAAFPQDPQRRAGADHAVIVGQRPFAPRPSDARSPLMAERIRRVRELEAHGARVSVIPIQEDTASLFTDLLAAAPAHPAAATGILYAPPPLPAGLAPDDAWQVTQQRITELKAAAEAIPDGAADLVLLVTESSRTETDASPAAAFAAYPAGLAAERHQQGDPTWLHLTWDTDRVDGGVRLLRRAVSAAGHRALTMTPPATDIPQATDPAVDTAAAEDPQSIQAPDPVTGSAPPPAAGFNHRPSMSTPFLAARTPLESTVAEVWQDILGIDRVGVHDSFFDLGGDSLLAMQVVARLRDTVGVDLSLRTLLEQPTVEAAATQIETAHAEPTPAAQPAFGSGRRRGRSARRSTDGTVVLTDTTENAPADRAASPLDPSKEADLRD